MRAERLETRDRDLGPRLPAGASLLEGERLPFAEAGGGTRSAAGDIGRDGGGSGRWRRVIKVLMEGNVGGRRGGRVRPKVGRAEGGGSFSSWASAGSAEGGK